MVDRDVGGGAGGHPGKQCVVRILDDCHAALQLDRRQAQREALGYPSNSRRSPDCTRPALVPDWMRRTALRYSVSGSTAI